MPIFQYQATTTTNQVVEGTISAPTREEVSDNLKKRQLTPLTIKQKQKKSLKSSSIPVVEKITFCRYVGTMLESGLSLIEGLPVLKEETKNPLMRQIIDDSVYVLQQGQTLSSALKMYPKVFDKFFIVLIEAGEVSGTLSDSFKFLEEQLRAEYSLSQKVKSALVYPSVVVVAMIGIGYLMLFFILPQISEVFLRMTIPLPKLTEAMFRSSLVIAKFRFPIIFGTLLAVPVLIISLKQPAGRRVVFKLFTPIPFISNLLQQIDVSRFCRIFSTLIASAVPITQSLDIALGSLTHPKYLHLQKTVIDKVSQGNTVAVAFKTKNSFPPLLIQMIAAGEKSGTLDTSLKDLASFYEEEVSESVKKATQLLEPILMLIVGVGVGGMILAIIAPLYSVIGNLQQMN